MEVLLSAKGMKKCFPHAWARKAVRPSRRAAPSAKRPCGEDAATIRPARNPLAILARRWIAWPSGMRLPSCARLHGSLGGGFLVPGLGYGAGVGGERAAARPAPLFTR